MRIVFVTKIFLALLVVAMVASFNGKWHSIFDNLSSFERPDIFGLIEITQGFLQRLSVLNETYPYRFEVPYALTERRMMEDVALQIGGRQSFAIYRRNRNR